MKKILHYLFTILFLTIFFTCLVSANTKQFKIKLDSKNKNQYVMFLNQKDKTEMDIKVKILSMSGKGTGQGHWVYLSYDTGKGSLFYNMDYASIKKNAIFQTKLQARYGQLDFFLPPGVKKLQCQVTITGKKIKSIDKTYDWNKAAEIEKDNSVSTKKASDFNKTYLFWYFPGQEKTINITDQIISKDSKILSNSNSNAFEAEIEQYGYSYTLKCTNKKPGTTKITVQHKYKNKTYKVTHTLKAVKYTNLLEKLTIGNKNCLSLLDKTNSATVNLDDVKGEFTIKVKPEWDITSILFGMERMTEAFREGKKLIVDRPMDITISLKDAKRWQDPSIPGLDELKFTSIRISVK